MKESVPLNLLMVATFFFGNGVQYCLKTGIILCARKINMTDSRPKSSKTCIVFAHFINFFWANLAKLLQRGSWTAFEKRGQDNLGMAIIFSGGSKGGAKDAPGVQILSISCKFGKIWQNRMLAPPPGELAPPSRGNPESATDFIDDHTLCPVILPLTELPHPFLQLASVPKLVNRDLFDQVLTRNILGEDGRHFDLGMSPGIQSVNGQ